MTPRNERCSEADELEADRRAKELLASMRRTPMRRGGRIAEQKRILQASIATTLEAEGVIPRLAGRIAFQLVLKFEIGDLGGRSVWRAIGRDLQRDVDQLAAGLGLVERQIMVGLPKLSAAQIEAFLEELRTGDTRIARTVLNAALDAADPMATGRRYLATYHQVAEQLNAVDAGLARTLANATFMARVPQEKALEHFTQFADLLSKFEGDVTFVRTLARAACRAPQPLAAARTFLSNYESVRKELESSGLEPQIARTIAGIASLSSGPRAAAYALVDNFEKVAVFVRKTHPWVARSIALSACRAVDPLKAARLYMANYDAVVESLSRTDPNRAHSVATQVFRSDNPLRWAARYLAQLQTA